MLDHCALRCCAVLGRLLPLFQGMSEVLRISQPSSHGTPKHSCCCAAELCSVFPTQSYTAGVPAAAVFKADTVLQARRGFQSQLSQMLSASASFDAKAGAVVSAAALFEELLPGLAAANEAVGAVTGKGSGVGAAMALYQHAVDAVPVEVKTFVTLCCMCSWACD